MSSYNKLEKIFREYYTVKQINSLLHWDHAVLMPSNSNDSRILQTEYLARLSYNILNKEYNLELIEQAKKENLSNLEKINLSLMEREITNTVILTENITAKIAIISAECEFKWRHAKKESNFKLVESSFEDLFLISKEAAEIKAAAKKISVYDTLLDSFEKSLNQKDIDVIFSAAKNTLPNIIDNIINKQLPSEKILSVDIDKQKIIAKEIMQIMKFDFTKGRLDDSTHPFCGGYSGDVRLTSRYDQEKLLDGIAAIIHETGHGLYEQNLPFDWQLKPIGSSMGMIIHESQSLLMERNILSNKKFVSYLSQILKNHLGDHSSLSNENIYNNLNQVRKSLIRIEADEVTYPLHVMMRYEIEKDLFAGKIKIKDIPDIWNAKTKDLFGIEPKNDAEGCLQDIHWYAGLFGYFPCYFLGAIAASQFSSVINSEINNLDTQLENGDFTELNQWLTRNIHSQGSKYDFQELLSKVTANKLDIKYFYQYIQTKYKI
jgi:carboxypeptidase Taq